MNSMPTVTGSKPQSRIISDISSPSSLSPVLTMGSTSQTNSPTEKFDSVSFWNAWAIVYALSMVKRKKKEHDFAVTAFRVVQEATGQTEEEPKPDIDYAALGHKGGLKRIRLHDARHTHASLL